MFYKEGKKYIIQDKKSRQFGVAYLTRKQLEKLYNKIGKELGEVNWKKVVIEDKKKYL